VRLTNSPGHSRTSPNISAPSFVRCLHRIVGRRSIRCTGWIRGDGPGRRGG
jgi:hypothetical protein